jgi:hypothetical protein
MSIMFRSVCEVYVTHFRVKFTLSILIRRWVLRLDRRLVIIEDNRRLISISPEWDLWSHPLAEDARLPSASCGYNIAREI